jgi:hypothetical protein
VSSDEETLWQEVLERPEDMAPRLALAQLWGGVRGEHIRAQIEESEAMRAGRSFSKPGMRAYQLAQGNPQEPGAREKRWAGAIADRVHAARFIRGFVEWIVVDAAVFVREWQELFALAPIRHLDLAHAKGVIDEVVDCPGLERVTGLSFNLIASPFYQPLGDAGARALAKSPRLSNVRYLNLGHSGLSEAAMAEIAASPNLPRLEMGDLYGNAILDLCEESGGEYGTSDECFWPGPGLIEFERRYGRREWLHAQERKGRQVFREEF